MRLTDIVIVVFTYPDYIYSASETFYPNIGEKYTHCELLQSTCLKCRALHQCNGISPFTTLSILSAIHSIAPTALLVPLLF